MRSFSSPRVSADEKASDVDERLLEHKPAAMRRKDLRDGQLRLFESRDRRFDAHDADEHRRRRPVEAEAQDAIHVPRFLYYLAHPVQAIAHVAEDDAAAEIRLPAARLEHHGHGLAIAAVPVQALHGDDE